MNSCARVKLPGGGFAIVCGSAERAPRCKFCALPYAAGTATLLCDAIVGRTLGGSPITCDRPVCASCAKEIGPNKHLCPAHKESINV